MSDHKFENKIKEIFESRVELPDGHRERFEQRLKNRRDANAGIDRPSRVISFNKWLTVAAAAAAILVGLIFIIDPSEEAQQQGTELADVRNYYRLLLEEQADATRQLAQKVDGKHREVLLANIERIENLTVPEVQIPDDEYIVLIADVYTGKIESLQNIQNILKEII